MAGYLKKENIICLSKKELYTLFEASQKSKLFREIYQRGLSLGGLSKDPKKLKEISDKTGLAVAEDRDEHEIFASLFIFSDFYENSDICFELDRFDSDKDRIAILEDLIKFRKGNSDSDFIIKSGKDFRKFQLKRYRGGNNTKELVDFIKNKVEHYGYNLGDTNLLIVPQNFTPYTEGKFEFKKVFEEITAMNLKFRGEILISYNDSNKNISIVRVYPELAITKIPIKLPSSRMSDFK